MLTLILTALLALKSALQCHEMKHLNITFYTESES